jgi:hypothetical protein
MFDGHSVAVFCDFNESGFSEMEARDVSTL